MRTLACILFFAVAGCAAVKPWQRGRLAAPAMQPEPDPYARAAEQSLYEIIEGATFAGIGEAGAGCGCH